VGEREGVTKVKLTSGRRKRKTHRLWDWTAGRNDIGEGGEGTEKGKKKKGALVKKKKILIRR